LLVISEWFHFPVSRSIGTSYMKIPLLNIAFLRNDSLNSNFLQLSRNQTCDKSNGSLEKIYRVIVWPCWQVVDVRKIQLLMLNCYQKVKKKKIEKIPVSIFVYNLIIFLYDFAAKKMTQENPASALAYL